MKRAGAVFAFLIAGSCLVDRRSTDFECETSADCGDGRGCSVTGYCIVADGVFACDDALMECSAQCTAEVPCRDLVCPDGYTCMFDCDAPGSCTSIDCTTASFCDVHCNETDACGPIVCGSNGGECDIVCNATNACASVTCGDACACDVDCNGDGCAEAASCPEATNGCSTGDGGCNSNRQGCDSC